MRLADLRDHELRALVEHRRDELAVLANDERRQPALDLPSSELVAEVQRRARARRFDGSVASAGADK